MIDGFKKYVSENENPNILIFLHSNADPDAVGAAFAFKELIINFNSSSNVFIFADGLNQSSKNALEDNSLTISTELPEIMPSSLIVTVDTANMVQLGIYKDFVQKSGLERMIIDHHSTKELAEGTLYSLIDPDAGSTCLIMSQIFFHYNINPSIITATLLIMGHLYDSRRFLHGSIKSSFLIMAKLIDLGGDYLKANEYLQNNPGLSERIAKLKAHQRLRYKYKGDIIIATSAIGAFEASAARSLISAGADISLVVSGKKDELRGSARAKHQLGINVAEIVTEICDEFGGEGGGHALAAGFNIKEQVSKKRQTEIQNRFISIVETNLSKIGQ